MARTLRDYIVEVLRPNAPGERAFFDQHRVKVTARTRGTNEKDGEEHFRATNVRVAPFPGRGREYDRGEDPAAEREEVDEAHTTHQLKQAWEYYANRGGTYPRGAEYRRARRRAHLQTKARKIAARMLDKRGSYAGGGDSRRDV